MTATSFPFGIGGEASELPLYRLSVAQYEAMIEAGILWHGCHVELLEGLLIEKRGRLRDDDPVVNGEQLPIYRLQAEDVETMRMCGILTDDTLIELRQGLLIRHI